MFKTTCLFCVDWLLVCLPSKLRLHLSGPFDLIKKIPILAYHCKLGPELRGVFVA